MQRRAKGRHDDVEAGPVKEAARRSGTRRLADLALALVAAGLLYAAARSGASTTTNDEPQQPLAKVFAFHRDEEFLLGDWLYWHCAVFGCSNVVVVDAWSTNPKVLAILEAYKTRGVTVETFRGAFGEKAEALSRAMRARGRGPAARAVGCGRVRRARGRSGLRRGRAAHPGRIFERRIIK